MSSTIVPCHSIKRAPVRIRSRKKCGYRAHASPETGRAPIRMRGNILRLSGKASFSKRVLRGEFACRLNPPILRRLPPQSPHWAWRVSARGYWLWLQDLTRRAWWRFPMQPRSGMRSGLPRGCARGAREPCEYLKRTGEDGQLTRERVRVPFPWARSALVCFASYQYADAPLSTKTQGARERVDCAVCVE